LSKKDYDWGQVLAFFSRLPRCLVGTFSNLAEASAYAQTFAPHARIVEFVEVLEDGTSRRG
jgi:hypothetical protein